MNSVAYLKIKFVAGVIKVRIRNSKRISFLSIVITATAIHLLKKIFKTLIGVNKLMNVNHRKSKLVRAMYEELSFKV